MLTVHVKGIGDIEVTEIPEEIPGHITIGNKKEKIPKNLYLYLWATTHATPRGVKKLDGIV